jgi:hypothetical protein
MVMAAPAANDKRLSGVYHCELLEGDPEPATIEWANAKAHLKLLQAALKEQGLDAMRGLSTLRARAQCRGKRAMYDCQHQTVTRWGQCTVCWRVPRGQRWHPLDPYSSRALSRRSLCFHYHRSHPSTMAQSRQMVFALRQGGQGLAAWAGLAVRSRDLTSSTCLQHVLPAPADDNVTPPAAEAAGKRRWQQELGAIRTDWT